MRGALGNVISHPALAIGSTLLWGMIEFVALWRSRWMGRFGHKL